MQFLELFNENNLDYTYKQLIPSTHYAIFTKVYLEMY